MAQYVFDSIFKTVRRTYQIMMKRLIALLLCLIMCVSVFAGCTTEGEDEDDDKGAYITMYLSDDIYDFDPANAYYNADALNVVSLMFETLFKLEEDGSVKKSLVKDYDFLIDKRTGEHYMEIVLHETYWSNGVQLSADDVAYSLNAARESASFYASSLSVIESVSSSNRDGAVTVTLKYDTARLPLLLDFPIIKKDTRSA